MMTPRESMRRCQNVSSRRPSAGVYFIFNVIICSLAYLCLSIH